MPIVPPSQQRTPCSKVSCVPQSRCSTALEQPHLVKTILLALVPVPLVSGVVVVVTEQVALAVALLAGRAAPFVHALLLAARAGHAGGGCRQEPGQSAGTRLPSGSSRRPAASQCADGAGLAEKDVERLLHRAVQALESAASKSGTMTGILVTSPGPGAGVLH